MDLLGRHPTCRQRSDATAHAIADTSPCCTRLAGTPQTRPQHLRQGLLLLELRHLRRLDLDGGLGLRAARHGRHDVGRAAAPPPGEGAGAPLLPLAAAPGSDRRSATDRRRRAGPVGPSRSRGAGIFAAGPVQRRHVRVEVVDQNEAPPAGLARAAAAASRSRGNAGVVRNDAGARRRPGLAQEGRDARRAGGVGRVERRPGLGIEQVVGPAVEGVVGRRVDVAPGHAVPPPDAELDVILPDLGGVALLDPVVSVVLVVAGLGPVVQDHRARRRGIRRRLRRYCKRRVVLIEQMFQFRHLRVLLCYLCHVFEFANQCEYSGNTAKADIKYHSFISFERPAGHAGGHAGGKRSYT